MTDISNSIKLKIGKFEYNITEDDKFLDNGCCVQLLTQSQEKKRRHDTERPNPKLSIALTKKIKKMELIQHPIPTRLAGCKDCELFSIKIERSSNET